MIVGTNQNPLVCTAGNLTAIANGLVVAIFDSSTLSIASVDAPATHLSIGSIGDLRILLESICRQRTGSKPLKMLSLNSSTPSSAFRPLIDRGPKTHLSRLTLNISNACNLWCSYCYADHGNYHAPSSLMPSDVAIGAVMRCMALYHKIEKIQFFGGEPLLNAQTIEVLCEVLEKKLGSNCPMFTATTNGTVLNTNIERILRDHKVHLTISLDGPPEIHDRLRPNRSGSSTYKTISRNIERLKSLGLTVDVECTYTYAHYHMGISVCDLLNFFEEQFSESTPHISWAYLPKPDLKNNRLNVVNGVFRDEFEEQSKNHLPVDIVEHLFREAARLSIKNICTGRLSALTFVIGILKRLNSRQHAVAYCPAFNSQLSIAADGSVYPCFMFIGDPRMKMGNLFDESFPTSSPKAFWNRYVDEFGESPTGTTEWYSGLMSGCVAGDYISTGSLGDRIYKSVYEAMIQEVLLGLAENGQR